MENGHTGEFVVGVVVLKNDEVIWLGCCIDTRQLVGWPSVRNRFYESYVDINLLDWYWRMSDEDSGDIVRSVGVSYTRLSERKKCRQSVIRLCTIKKNSKNSMFSSHIHSSKCHQHHHHTYVYNSYLLKPQDSFMASINGTHDGLTCAPSL